MLVYNYKVLCDGSKLFKKLSLFHFKARISLLGNWFLTCAVGVDKGYVAPDMRGLYFSPAFT